MTAQPLTIHFAFDSNSQNAQSSGSEHALYLALHVQHARIPGVYLQGLVPGVNGLPEPLLPGERDALRLEPPEPRLGILEVQERLALGRRNSEAAAQLLLAVLALILEGGGEAPLDLHPAALLPLEVGHVSLAHIIYLGETLNLKRLYVVRLHPDLNKALRSLGPKTDPFDVSQQVHFITI